MIGLICLAFMMMSLAFEVGAAALRVDAEKLAIQMQPNYMDHENSWKWELVDAKHLSKKNPFLGAAREAQALAALGKIAEAQSRLQLVRELPYKMPYNHSQEVIDVATTMAFNGYIQESDDLFEELVKDPKAIHAAHVYAWTLINAKRKPERILELAEQVFPRDTAPQFIDYTLLATALLENDRAREADAVLAECAEKFPELLTDTTKDLIARCKRQLEQ